MKLNFLLKMIKLLCTHTYKIDKINYLPKLIWIHPWRSLKINSTLCVCIFSNNKIKAKRMLSKCSAHSFSASLYVFFFHYFFCWLLSFTRKFVCTSSTIRITYKYTYLHVIRIVQFPCIFHLNMTINIE